MAHQSLYRAYRPQSFKEVIGQDEVTGPLGEQIKAEKVGHAYLFAGSRGLGKTSIARIFAKELGCTEKDLYEIDAASHNGVDHIRELSENVYTLPFESPYKVYILDEAHMLSKGAWNAFLKTLEEPPAHAIFILATTELEKIPETVQSRCQVFMFKKPTRPGLAKLVATVAKKEGYTLEPSVSDLVALLGDGSYRDALSVLEKVLSVSKDTKITREEAEKATGAPRRALVEGLVTALAEGNKEQSLINIRSAGEEGIDYALYLSLVLEQIRMVLLVRHAPELRKEISEEVGEEEYAEIKRVAEAPDSKLTHQTLKAFLDAASRIRFSPIPALPLELAVFEVLGQD
ncbi:DNA polymerase III subunit gamma/tau [Patescibacteria group bacterium]|nr:DNA polymerase III subunit gamma/tau [Patescibacteria group bacterium]MBU1754910.1 DNA polymerase III subunit gamma/tau [Patescibacteria group bacterium]